jgi:hypothetical protein
VLSNQCSVIAKSTPISGGRGSRRAVRSSSAKARLPHLGARGSRRAASHHQSQIGPSCPRSTQGGRIVTTFFGSAGASPSRWGEAADEPREQATGQAGGSAGTSPSRRGEPADEPREQAAGQAGGSAGASPSRRGEPADEQREQAAGQAGGSAGASPSQRGEATDEPRVVNCRRAHDFALIKKSPWFPSWKQGLL